MGTSFYDFMTAPKPKRSAIPTYGKGSESETTHIAPDQQGRMAEQAARPMLERIDLPGDLQKDANQFVQGGTFGWSDEGLAKLQSMFRGESYDDALKRERTGLAKFQQEHPYRSASDQFLGGATTSALVSPFLGPAAAATTIPGRIARTAVQGAFEGGLSGAGSAEGDLRNKAAHGVLGAAGGGLIAGTIGALGEGASRLSRIGETPQQAGDRMISEAFGRDNVTMDAALQRAQEFSDDKPGIMLDLGDRNTQRLGRTVRTNVGRGSNELDEGLTRRMHGTEERVQGDIAATIGLGPRENAFRQAEAMIADRSARARPLYEKAYAGEPVDDPRVHALMQFPEFQDAYARGRHIAKRFDKVDLPDLSETQGGPIPIQGLDYLKRGMDAIIEGKMKTGGLTSFEASRLRGEVRDMLSVVDELRPDYKAARAQFKGDSELMDAFKQGGTVFTMKSGAIEHELGNMSAGEQEMFRRGGMDALYNRVEERLQSRNPLSLTERTVDRKRVRALFANDDDFAAFQKRLEEEGTMHRTRTAVQGGSNTADKIAELADMADVDTGAFMDVATGNTGAIMRRVINSMVAKRANEWRQSRTAARSDALATRFTAGLESKQQLINALKEVKANTASSAARPVTAAGAWLARNTNRVAPVVAGTSMLFDQTPPKGPRPAPTAFPASAGQAPTPQEEEAYRRFQQFMQTQPPQR